MNNIQDFIGNSNMFRTFKVDELLFAEFKCPVEASSDVVWCTNNFFGFIVSGQTVVKTLQQEYVMQPGDSIFVKKGSIRIESEYQENFCELLVFVPDDFIRSVFQKYKISIGNSSSKTFESIYPFGADEILQTYSQSLLSYFNLPTPPLDSLLKLKFEELIISILSGAKYHPLKSYFEEIANSKEPSIKNIMEENFICNLSLPEFARLCSRSLSSFKAEFSKIFGTTPGKWLTHQRLMHGKFLLETTNYSLDEVCMSSGFENKSHFSRVFKKEYGAAPGKYRQKIID